MDQKPRVLQIFHDYKGPFCSVARHYAKCFEDCDVRTIFLRGEESEEIAATITGDVRFMGLSSKSLRGLKLIAAAKVASLIGEDVPDILITHRYKPFFSSLTLNFSLQSSIQSTKYLSILSSYYTCTPTYIKVLVNVQLLGCNLYTKLF